MGASLADSAWWLSQITGVQSPLFDLCILTAILALTEARGAAGLLVALFLEADWSVVG